MFAVYLDESGTHSEAPIAGVAGCLSTVESWDAFSSEWKAILEERQLTHFHMTDCEGGYGEFKGWTPDDRKDLVKRLITVMKRHILHVFAAVVVIADHRSLPLDLQDIWKPYPYCANTVAGMIAAHMKRKRKGFSATLVFEDGARHRGLISDAFVFRKKYNIKGGDRIASVSFADKKTVLPLQAADILVYESVKSAKRACDGQNRPMRASLAALLDGVRHSGLFCNGQYYLDAIKYLKAHPTPPTMFGTHDRRRGNGMSA